ncbi:MAG: glycosyl hydrolase [Clostridiales bacterium]|nr:glycosyl hydrolase [Clostridiales bacterium]
MRKAQAPLFMDPIFNGAADPTIIWNRQEKEWWIIYTQRHSSGPGPGVTNIHGSELGVASSKDGHDFYYRGTLEGLHFEHGHNTFWAPEVLYHEGKYHMYVSYVRGMPTHWGFPRDIIHYTSENLWEWHFESKLTLSSHKVIDACVAEIEPGHWRMWYKDEADNSYCHYSDSHDLYHWENMGRAIADEPHEGPNVFYWQNKWWYIGDYWKGQKCFSSDDCTNWEYAGMILDKPGKRPHDQAIGNHADVLVLGEEAYIFYFSHVPVPEDIDKTKPLPQEYKTLAVQVARLHTDGRMLYCDRDEEFDFVLPEL